MLLLDMPFDTRRAAPIALLLVCASAAVLFACSSAREAAKSSDDEPSADPSESGEDAGASDDDDADTHADTSKTKPDSGGTESSEPLACKNKLTAAPVTIKFVDFYKLPSATGGTLVEGHYVLKALTAGDDSSKTESAELWIRSGRYDLVQEDDFGQFRYGGTIKASGKRLVMTNDCGGQQWTPTWDYSASGTSLSVQFTNINGFSFLYRFERAKP